MRQLTEYCALSRAYIYQKINEGTFPPGHMISPGIRAWEKKLWMIGLIKEWGSKHVYSGHSIPSVSHCCAAAGTPCGLQQTAQQRK